MESLYSFNQSAYPFELFSLSHMSMILVTIILLVLLYFLRDRATRKTKTYIKYTLIAALIGGEVFFHGWYLANNRWDIIYNLPLQLSSISIYLCTFMLVTKNYRVFEISFFISMTSALIAIITPELFFGAPHLRFFQFFIVHIAIVLACFYMVWFEGYKATATSVIRAFLVLNFIVGCVFIINHLTGANYMFLSRKPNNATVIDLLGPYPWYILALEAIALSSFILLYLALFKRKTKRGD
ncbi:putative integral membrane protein (TIGR02206 family) [Streptohalobacillus salinus]|uniref:Putative integral membrane protein (TIGR02206 family) n=1 Tax=Streptohalobacillus salinus TaxID=621096 RepID=A0A2V3WBG1_9BACI|nr:TIGR02206 family membrane protein [Streptohalobacillus salinus]PXW91793.1 putative integral membrane protein (TIGR02206 family) [Streptohalobacillus salinus]